MALARACAAPLWPKDGGYIVPVTVKVRAAEVIELGDLVAVRMVIGRQVSRI